MSYQVCHCGWSKITSYQGLRTHQGKKGCTMKGMRIPESEQFRLGYLTCRTPINIEEPLMNIFTPALMSAGEYTLGDTWQESHQRDTAALIRPSRVRNENVSANLTTTMAVSEAAVMEIFKSLGQEAQQQSLRTATNSDHTHRALDFNRGPQLPQISGTQTHPAPPEVTSKDKQFGQMEAQQWSLQPATKSHQAPGFTSSSQLMPLPQIFGTQMNSAPREVTVMDKPLFETPPPNSTTHQTTNNVRRTLDFSPNEPQTVTVFSNVTTTPSPTQAAGGTIRSFGQMEAQQWSPQTATQSHQAPGFTSSSQLMPLPQIFGTQMNSAPRKVTVKDKSLFETPPPNSTTHQTTNNVRRTLDFSPNEPQTVTVFSNVTTTPSPAQAAGGTIRSFGQMDAQQWSPQTATKSHQAPGFTSSSQLMPLPQIFGTQMNSAPREVTVKDKPLFETPPPNSTTHQTTNNVRRTLDFSPNEPQTVTVFSNVTTTQSPAQAEVAQMETQEHSLQTAAKSHQTLGFTRSSQPSLMPMAQIFSTQVNPAPAEVAVKEMNKPMFGYPQYKSTTQQTTMNAQGGQLGSEIGGFPKTTSEETAIRSQEREKEREKEKEKEKGREAQKQHKAKQDKIRADLEKKIQITEKKMVEVTSSAKACKGDLDAEWLEINNVFLEVMRVVEDARQEALQPLEKRRQEVKQEAHYLVQKMQKEIDKLKKTIDELDKKPDLKVSPLTDHKESRDWKNVTVNTSLSFGTLRTSTSDMMEQIQQKLETLSSVELKRISTFAVDVKLDPTSAHRNLVLSSDLKTVRDGGKSQKLPDVPQRFDTFGSILGRDRLTFGKSYWEVEVSNKTGWDLGVARGDANRKGKLSLNPENGYWVTVHYEDKNYAALTVPPVSLSLTGKPRKVGVFVDYEEGLVSFYDVKAQSHIYSFTGCSFSGAIFPYFSPHLKQNENNSYPLIISAVTKQ